MVLNEGTATESEYVFRATFSAGNFKKKKLRITDKLKVFRPAGLT